MTKFYKQTVSLLLFLLVSFTHSYGENAKVVLMLDCSHSMKPNIEELKRSAKQFINTTPLSCTDVAIYTFGSLMYKPFTNDKDDLLNFIDKIEAMGGTPLYSCLERVYLNIYKKRVKGICLFSDGKPTDEAKLQGLKIREDVPIYSIGYNLDEDSKDVLKNLSSKSNGEARFSSDINELARLFSDFSVRISSKSLTTDILPVSKEKEIPHKRGQEIKGYYYFDKSILFSTDIQSEYTNTQKHIIVQYLKEYGYPNALYFGENNELKLLTIDEESNQSEWLDGTIRFYDNMIDIQYTYVHMRYDIEVEVYNSYNNTLILKLVSFYENEDWALIKEGKWLFNNNVTSLMIYFKKDYCAR